MNLCALRQWSIHVKNGNLKNISSRSWLFSTPHVKLQTGAPCINFLVVFLSNVLLSIVFVLLKSDFFHPSGTEILLKKSGGRSVGRPLYIDFGILFLIC